MFQIDKGLIKGLRILAKDLDKVIPCGCGRDQALMLRAAADRLAMLAQGMNDAAKADRIIQLEREKHDIMHLWRMRAGVSMPGVRGRELGGGK